MTSIEQMLRGMGGPPPDPAMMAAQQQLHDMEHEFHLHFRAETVRLAAILCNCDRRFDWTDPRPPQVRCIIHGQLVFSPDGSLLA